MTIALTGAAGNLGRLVAEQLLALTDPADVVLITRRPEAVADAVATARSVVDRVALGASADTSISHNPELLAFIGVVGVEVVVHAVPASLG